MGYQFELRHLRYFLAVAEDLHFRKAAERLYISQPGLSRQIKELEALLGIKLFERSNRKVALTKAGSFLKVELKKQFMSLERIIQHAKLLNDGLIGNLKLGYVGSAMQEIIPNLLLGFKKKYPDIMYSLTEMDNKTQVDSLLSQDIDFGFVRSERTPEGLALWPLLIEPFCLVLPRNHPVNTDNFKGLHQLKGESFILFDKRYNPSYYEKVMQLFDDGGFVPKVTHITIHSNSIYKLVAHGFGISIVPKSLRSESLAEIKFIELKEIPQKTTLSAIWNTDNRNPLIYDFLSEVKRSRDK